MPSKLVYISFKLATRENKNSLNKKSDNSYQMLSKIILIKFN